MKRPNYRRRANAFRFFAVHNSNSSQAPLQQINFFGVNGARGLPAKKQVAIAYAAQLEHHLAHK
jgi:hypothetical protein